MATNLPISCGVLSKQTSFTDIIKNHPSIFPTNMPGRQEAVDYFVRYAEQLDTVANVEKARPDEPKKPYVFSYTTTVFQKTTSNYYNRPAGIFFFTITRDFQLFDIWLCGTIRIAPDMSYSFQCAVPDYCVRMISRTSHDSDRPWDYANKQLGCRALLGSTEIYTRNDFHGRTWGSANKLDVDVKAVSKHIIDVYFTSPEKSAGVLSGWAFKHLAKNLLHTQTFISEIVRPLAARNDLGTACLLEIPDRQDRERLMYTLSTSDKPGAQEIFETYARYGVRDCAGSGLFEHSPAFYGVILEKCPDLAERVAGRMIEEIAPNNS